MAFSLVGLGIQTLTYYFVFQGILGFFMQNNQDTLPDSRAAQINAAAKGFVFRKKNKSSNVSCVQHWKMLTEDNLWFNNRS